MHIGASVLVTVVTKGTCHRLGSPCSCSVSQYHREPCPETRLAHGAPARRASQNRPWNQIVSPPSSGHRRSGAPRRSIKKALARAGTPTVASGKKEQKSSTSCYIAPRFPKTDLQLMSVGSMTQNAHAQSLLLRASWTPGISDSALRTAPSLSWEQGIRTILGLGKDAVELDDMVAGFIDAAFLGRQPLEFGSAAGFGAGGPCHSIHDGAK